QHDVFFYITMMNENYAQPTLPASAHADVIKGLYRWDTSTNPGALRLLGSGAILREVIAARQLLADDWQIDAEVWSATSFSELAREAHECERWNRLNPDQAPRTSHLAQCLPGGAPIVAASDSVRAWPQLIATQLGAPFTVLGTDGFGRSDTRAALRRFFEVDRHQIVLAALTALAGRSAIDAGLCARAIARYGLAADADAPWNV
ncbi:MAG: pyruvate dehydrogenase (acetyl-transferring), homodimeric type, partial [Burkholderiales bacterium]